MGLSQGHARGGCGWGGLWQALAEKRPCTALLVRWDPDSEPRRGSECEGGGTTRMKGKPKEGVADGEKARVISCA